MKEINPKPQRTNKQAASYIPSHDRAMHKATIFVAAVFALVAISLGLIVFARRHPSYDKRKGALLRFVRTLPDVPRAAGDNIDMMQSLMAGGMDGASDPFLDRAGGENSTPAAENPMVPLNADEMLLASLMVDTDGDALPDQVLALLKGNSVVIVFVRYDSGSNLYARAFESTMGVKAQNVSLSAMDMTGDHNLEIICHGNTSDSLGAQKTVMTVFAKSKKIGEFIADSVYTETVDRPESYNLSQAAGEPFHVWTYNEQKGGDETRTEWNYSAKSGQYAVIREQHIAASDIKEREMSHIKSSLPSFNTFLNGLWYRTTNTDGQRFVYFDKRAKEIIFVYQDNEELYVWGNGSLHGRGAVITTTNAAIRTMRRRCDLAVTATDEIHLRVTDDVSIVKNDTSSWDGTYRKMPPGSRLPSAAQSVAE